MSAPSREQQLRLLAAVDALPPAHDCPGLDLWECCDHPKWRAVRGGSEPFWYVIAPHGGLPDTIHSSHAVAVRHATERARAQHLAAIEAQPDEVCS